jgi:hypothetical protein
MVAAGLAGLLLEALPASAAERNPFAEFDAQVEQLLSPQAWLRGKVSEADVALLFAYLKASLFAASMDLPAPAVPEEFRQRAEELKRDLKMHGALTGLLLLNALEAGVKQAVREALGEPVPAR